MRKTVVLYRPVGIQELALIQLSGWKSFPSRLLSQPFFYPVVDRGYAEAIARDWNAKQDGQGFVTQFSVDERYLQAYPVRQAGGRTHQEYWIPASELAAFNGQIVGRIEVVESSKELVS